MNSNIKSLGYSLEGVFDMSSTKTYDAQGREIK